MNETSRSIHDELSRERFEADGDRGTKPPSDDLEAQVAYWQARFEEERELLTKLWVAYRDVEAELDLYNEEVAAVAQRKAAAQLAQAERARAEGEETDDGEHPGVLAIAPPDEFEVICEAEERDVVVGRGTSFPLVFVNRGQSPVDVELSVEESPEGWSTLTTEEEIELEPRSSRTVYVLVRPAADTPAGEKARITVAVATSDGTEEEIELAAEVVEPPEDDTEDRLDADEADTAEGSKQPESEADGAPEAAPSEQALEEDPGSAGSP